MRWVWMGMVVLMSAWAGRAEAQPVRGVVWEVPDDPALAQQDLVAMHAMGVEAVRTGLLRNEVLLTIADTLGLELYQELPVAYLHAEALSDTLAFAERLLGEALERATRHPSARTFGLARHVATADTTACAYLSTLTRRVRNTLPPDAQTYYVSDFPEADRCAGAVDFVLLDALDAPEPQEHLARWRSAERERGPVGLAALGTWARADTVRGLLQPHSHEAQARYLETHLDALLADTSVTAVFVHRWRDAASAEDVPMHFAPFHTGYGLIAASGTKRPVFHVVEGFYTGRQTVFAFARGAEPRPGWPWIVLLGWGVVALLGVLFASAPRFRHMVPRYFFAHAFYCEALRGRRDVMPEASALLLLVWACSIGLLTVFVLEALTATAAFRVVLWWMGEGARAFVLTLLEQPWMLALLTGSVYALALALWTSLFSLASRRRAPLLPGQAFMLVVWPRWPVLLLLVGGMVGSTLSPPAAREAALLIVGLWVVTALLSIRRTVADFRNVTRVRAGWLVVLVVLNPLVVIAFVGGITALAHTEALSFLWHLVR